MAEQRENEPLSAVHSAMDANRFGEALQALQGLATAHPQNPELYYLAGQCLMQLNDHEAALDAFQRAIRIKADWPAPHLGTAQALLRRGDAFASMQTLLHVLSIDSQDLDATRQLVELLARLKPDSYLTALEPALYQCFAHPGIDPGPLTHICGQQLRLSIADLLEADEQAFAEKAIERLAGNDLWCHYLSRVVNTDPYLERFLTRLRRHFCLDTGYEADDSVPLALVAALAQQCFLNEYVFALSAEETSRLAAMERLLQESNCRPETAVLSFVFSCLYRAPRLDTATRELAQVLSRRNPSLESLCQLTVFEPFDELQIAEKLPALHPVHHDSSLAVQAQYEVNPYPRWQAPPAPAAIGLVNEFYRQFSIREELPKESDGARLLVAGCGTGFEPIDIARRDSSIVVTAIDLSRRSLAYAKRKAQSLDCTNVALYQGDILDLSHTDWMFDIIVCTGVLHHMDDPLAGWRVLRSKLTAAGMMRISLYSAVARRPIQVAREHIRMYGIAGQPDDIRDFRRSLMNEAADPELAILLHSDDFYSMSGCRDLLFHVQEHHFTPTQIQMALDELNLRFCGFDFSDTTLLEAFCSQYPDPGARRDLEKWEKFEESNPHIFSGMYQFWCEPE